MMRAMRYGVASASAAKPAPATSTMPMVQRSCAPATNSRPKPVANRTVAAPKSGSASSSSADEHQQPQRLHAGP